MIYLSKGVSCRDSSGSDAVSYAGKIVKLNREQKILWENGRYGFAETADPEEKTTVATLIRLGLAECEVKSDAVSQYRLLTRCFICPAKKDYNLHRLRDDEREIYTWLSLAGIRLTVAELIYLTEHGIKPTEDLLYAKNRQALVERIYTRETIADRILECQMEDARCRDSIVNCLANMLRKNYLIVL